MKNLKLLIKIEENQSPEIKQYLLNYYRNYQKTHLSDSGLDLVIPKDYSLHEGVPCKINLGICCQLVAEHPRGYYLYPRSSLSKTQIRLANSVGIIDWSYTGPIIAAVDHFYKGIEVVKAGTKLFQICMANLKPFEIEVVDTLIETSRGSGGFGSTDLID